MANLLVSASGLDKLDTLVDTAELEVGEASGDWVGFLVGVTNCSLVVELSGSLALSGEGGAVSAFFGSCGSASVSLDSLLLLSSVSSGTVKAALTDVLLTAFPLLPLVRLEVTLARIGGNSGPYTLSLVKPMPKGLRVVTSLDEHAVASVTVLVALLLALTVGGLGGADSSSYSII